MRESLRIDSFPFMGAGMPKAYSRDLRERVITAVETGASRREEQQRAFRGQRGVGGKVAAALVSAEGSAAPKPRGGSVRRWKSSRSRFWI